jgi:hypothetical protein
MAGNTDQVLEGGCTCRRVRYRMAGSPLFVHCCHCSWCQRETGSAFVINALIEADRVALLTGDIEIIDTPSASGKGQKIHRCPGCKVAVWSHYADAGATIVFVRVGTLDEPSRISPDIHIFTSTKLPWVRLPAKVPVVEEFYRFEKHWPRESLERFAASRSRGRT